MHHQNVDFTKLFSIIDVIVCSLWECTDDTGTKYFVSVGYVANQIVLKLDTEDNISLYRFESTSVRDAKQKMEWIITENKLVVSFATYYYDPITNMTLDFYFENQIQYSFSSRNRSGKPIQVNYTIYSLDIEIDYQGLCDRYNEFIIILSQNELGLGVVEVSVNPNRYLRKSKLLSLLAD
ncbi:MAG: hypothetical protein AB9846_02805 [Tenuifilaceae bacterium]